MQVKITFLHLARWFRMCEPTCLYVSMYLGTRVNLLFQVQQHSLIIRSEESYRLWRVAVCDQATSYARRLKPDRVP